MKKIFVSLLLFALILPVFGQNQDEFKFSLVPRRLAVPSLTGYLKADGTVPLTANWLAGNFDLTIGRVYGSEIAYNSPTFAGVANPTTGLALQAVGWYLVHNGVATFYGGTSGHWVNYGLTVNSNGDLKIEGKDITAGAGTGLTVNSTGNVNRQVYKVTVDYTGFSAAALTADHTIATLPAKTKIVGFYADTTVPFTGGTVSAAALTVGKSAGGVEYIATHDVLSGAIVRGLADADMGTELTRAAAIQGGAVVNWTGTTTVSARLTTVTANTDQLTAGSVTFYIVTERF